MEENILIIAHGYVLTCDSAHRGGDYSLLVRNGRITEITGNADSLLARHPGVTVFDAHNKLVTPGFVNAHAHSESILFRTLTDGKPLAEWSRDPRVVDFQHRLLRVEHDDDLRGIYQAAYLAHLKSGTTSVGEYTLPVGGRGLQTIANAIAQTAVKTSLVLQNRSQIDYARLLPRERERFIVGLGEEKDFSVALVNQHVSMARALGCPLLAHVCEQSGDADVVKRRFARSAIEFLADHQALGPTAFLAHCNHACMEEVERVKKQGTSIVLSGLSAAHKRTGYPLLRHLRFYDGRLCIGTDWGNSDMLAEMKFLSHLPLVLHDAPTFSPIDLLRMATINAAHALRMSEEIGSIEPGKKADLLFFSLGDIRSPSLMGHPTVEELARHLITYCTAGDISDVMIDGTLCVAGGRVTIPYEAEMVAAFRAIHERWYEESTSGVPGKKPETPADAGTPRMAASNGFLYADTDERLEKLDEGFSIITKTPSSLQSTAASSRPASTPLVQPELPKDVRKTFGDDDEI